MKRKTRSPDEVLVPDPVTGEYPDWITHEYLEDPSVYESPDAVKALSDLETQGFDRTSLGALTEAAFQEQADLIGDRFENFKYLEDRLRKTGGPGSRYVPTGVLGGRDHPFLRNLLEDVDDVLGRGGIASSVQRGEVRSLIKASFDACLSRAKPALEAFNKRRLHFKDTNCKARKFVRTNLVHLVLELISVFKKHRKSSRSKPTPYRLAAGYVTRCGIRQIRISKGSKERRKELSDEFSEAAIRALYLQWHLKESELPPPLTLERWQIPLL